MVFVCTFPVEVPAIEQYYQYLGRSLDNRYYYIPRNYLEEFFKINKEEDGLDIFLKELSDGQIPITGVLSAWLGSGRDLVIHLDVDEMDTFIELVAMSKTKDVYLNLMENEEGTISVGQHIFLNSLPEIVRRYRDE